VQQAGTRGVRSYAGSGGAVQKTAPGAFTFSYAVSLDLLLLLQAEKEVAAGCPMAFVNSNRTSFRDGDCQ